MCFGECGNLRQHRDCFLGKFAHRRFAREHDAISAVKYRVGDVGCLGARRQTARNHRFEHLRRSDDWFSGEIRFGNELLLCVGDFLNRHLHTEIAARDHDTIRCCENFVEVRKRVGPLDLCNDEWLRAQFLPQPRAQLGCLRRVQRMTGPPHQHLLLAQIPDTRGRFQ